MPPSAAVSLSGPRHTDDHALFRAALVGQRIQSVQVQQFWLHSVCVDPGNVVFLQLGSGQWLRFFFDAPLFCWREVAAPHRPVSAVVFDAEGFAFPVMQVALPPEWKERAVAEVAFGEGASHAVELRLEGGGALLLEERDDCGQLSLRS